MSLSLLVYISSALLLFFFGWHVNLRESKSVAAGTGTLPFYSWEIVASIMLIVFIMGARFKTGTDYMMYWAEYLQVGKGYDFSRVDGFESGYEFITRLFAQLHLHYSIYFGFWALLQAGLLYWGLRKHKFLLPWMGLLLMLGPYSINWFSFMRQWVITCAFVPMLYLIERRKFWLFAVLTILLYTIHSSALILLFFYFIPYKKISELPQKYHFGILIALFLLGIKPYWVIIFKPLLNLLPLLGYGRYSVMFDDLLMGHYRWIAWGPLHFIMIYALVLPVVYYKKIREYRPDDSMLPIYFGLAFIAVGYDLLFANTIHFLLRPNELLYIFDLIMIAYVCNYLCSKKKFGQLLLVLLPIISYVIINVTKTYLNPTSTFAEYINYHFFFLYSL